MMQLITQDWDGNYCLAINQYVINSVDLLKSFNQALVVCFALGESGFGWCRSVLSYSYQ